MDYTQKQIKEKFDALPTDIQDSVSSANIEQKVFELGKKQGLHIDQTGELAEETGLVMLGLTHPNKFAENLKKRLGIGDEKASELIRGVNEEIFKPIKHSLVELHDMEPSHDEQQEPLPSKEEIMKEVEDEKATGNQEPVTDEQKLKPEVAAEQGYESLSGQIVKRSESLVKDMIHGQKQVGDEQKQIQKGIMQQKLDGAFKIPSEENVLEDKETKQKKDSKNKDDPYRETIE